jgi:hypothetical protein
MGRSAVVVKPIEDTSKRKATFQKRRAGIMKKAMELSVLCHCDIALVVFDEHGDLHQYASTDMRKTLKRAFSHKGRRDLTSNDALLRSHGVMKKRAAEEQPESLNNRIDLTPSSSCGLSLSAESFGPILAKNGVVRRPQDDASAQPRTPDRGFCSSDDESGVSPQPGRPALPAMTDENNYAKTLPPRVQRHVEALMRDISLVHAAGELCVDPFMMNQPPQCHAGRRNVDRLQQYDAGSLHQA